MSTLTKGPLLLRGFVDDKPELPDGWVYREIWSNWLFAVAPNGREYYYQYYVSREKLYRCKMAGILDVIRTFIKNRGQYHLKRGQHFIDKREVIQL